MSSSALPGMGTSIPQTGAPMEQLPLPLSIPRVHGQPRALLRWPSGRRVSPWQEPVLGLSDELPAGDEHGASKVSFRLGCRPIGAICGLPQPALSAAQIM